MPVFKQGTVYLYLQPIRTSITTLQQSKITSDYCQLDLIRSSSSNQKVKNVYIKIRDIMKINKQYQVYGSQLHFYNAVFQVNIKQRDLSILEEETLTLQLKSQNRAQNFQTRKYNISIGSLIELADDKENLVNQIGLKCQGNGSQLFCKVIHSEISLSLQSLQEMFEYKQSSPSKSNSQSELFKCEFLQTNASSTNEGSFFGKFQRTTVSCKNIQGKLIRRPKKKLLGVDKQQISNKSISWKQLRINGNENKTGDLDQSLYDQPPKKRRISRIRRSILVPIEIQSQEDEQEFMKSMNNYKNMLQGGLQNLFLLMGVVMIYAMMIPSRRI